MQILIQTNICDNSIDCSGIEVCPTHAFHWDEKAKTIAIDQSKCVECGKCGESCPVGAIRIARNAEEYARIKKEIAEDKRKVSDLFVDRYGAQPVSSSFLIPEDKFDAQILKSTKIAVVELFDKGSIMCLLYSIPIKELFEGTDVKYRKIELKNYSSLITYGVDDLPALLFFNNGKLVGKILGYYNIDKKEELKLEIDKILRNES